MANAAEVPPARGISPRGSHDREIQQAILTKEVTTVEVVELYLARIKAYNGTCVNEPKGMLGPVTTIPHAGQLNALSTLNLRPARAPGLGLRRPQGAQHDRRGRRRSRDARRARDGRGAGRRVRADRRLVGPLHGVVHRDQGSVRHVRHAHHVGRRRLLRRTIARPTMPRSSKRLRARRRDHPGQGQPGRVCERRPRSSFGGTFCNPYDTERTPGRSSAGSAIVGRRESRDLRDRRGNRLVDPRPGARQQRRRPRADAGARQPRRHDAAPASTRASGRSAARCRTPRRCSTSSPATTRRTS